MLHLLQEPDDHILVPPFTKECGLNHTNCMYKRAYPDQLINSEHGPLEPEMLCPNKALHSLHFLSMDAKENHDQSEVGLAYVILLYVQYINSSTYKK